MSIEFGWENVIKILKAITVISVLGMLATGCASVKLSAPSEEAETAEAVAAGARERTALISATRQLSRTPWPTVEEVPLSSRMVNVMFGVAGKNSGRSQDDALGIYVRRLTREDYPVDALMRDANATLRKARRVAEAGRLAAGAIRPSSEDIAVLEAAISEVRGCREMYVGALKQLKKSGYEVSKQDQRELKEAFSQTIRDIGNSADLVAERIAARRTISQFAGSSVTARN